MDTIRTLDAIPLWGFFVLALVLVLLAIEGGYRLGRFGLTLAEHEKEAPVGTMVAAMHGLRRRSACARANGPHRAERRTPSDRRDRPVSRVLGRRF